jgi:hypothetical protein
MGNKKISRGHKSVFIGDKPSPQKNYPTPGEQIADLVLKDMAKGNIEGGVNLLKRNMGMKKDIEKECEGIKKSLGMSYDIEEFIERGFW